MKSPLTGEKKSRANPQPRALGFATTPLLRKHRLDHIVIEKS
jgi:hypothetical protein